MTRQPIRRLRARRRSRPAGVAYVFLYPLPVRRERGPRSGRRRSSRRAPTGASAIAAVSRKDQVAQSLKELEAQQKAQDKLTLETRIAQAGLAWTRADLHVVSAIAAGRASAIADPGRCREAVPAALGAAFVGRRRPAALGARAISGSGASTSFTLRAAERGRRHRARHPVRPAARRLPAHRRERSAGAAEDASSGSIIEAQTSASDDRRGHRQALRARAGLRGEFLRASSSRSSRNPAAISPRRSATSRKVLRERRKMGGKIKAMSMEAKASAAIIGALPFTVAILTYLSSPDYIALLWTTQTGKIALDRCGLMWMTIGIFVDEEDDQLRVLTELQAMLHTSRSEAPRPADSWRSVAGRHRDGGDGLDARACRSLEGDGLDKRMKAVAIERERIRARERERLAKAQPEALAAPAAQGLHAPGGRPLQARRTGSAPRPRSASSPWPATAASTRRWRSCSSGSSRRSASSRRRLLPVRPRSPRAADR